ncbi:hypothetical protein NPN18_26615, partial [Vibrio parahaemolyticus]|nr:hypothetical protein [Vibrio parahaemolyticus]
RVNGAGDAVLELGVDLGDGKALIGSGFLKISTTGSVDDISHGESLDGFILCDESSAVRAGDRLNVASTLLASSVISSLG